MQEEFLYYLWQYRLLYPSLLHLESGETLEVLHPGYRNHESGPDFFNARLRIAGLLWAGNVELHVKSSDWEKHGHRNDPAYDHIILHVVHGHDAELKRSDGSAIPTLVMDGKYPPEYLEHYKLLMQGAAEHVSCSRQLNEVPDQHKTLWLDRLLTERLESRFKEIDRMHLLGGKSWPQTFYRVLAKGFGFRTNALPFELLSQAVPYDLMLRHRHVPEELEGLYFGQAGLLPPGPSDPYAERLRKHYRYFRHKYQLSPLSAHLWKFGGLRPLNFPTLRISQFAMLHHSHEHLPDKVISAVTIEELYRVFDISVSDYWYHHFRFGSPADPLKKVLGRDSIRNLLINAVIPFLFYYGRRQHLQVLCDKALYWMEQLEPEKNRITRQWLESGWKARDAGQSQALLHLKKHYCDYKKCVNCGIGKFLLSQSCTHS
ncbi:MAG: DUF2851 family protein [Bacteroidia bacterium]|nr:DUF2851 family protein [Bacteroidia bacterium]